MKSGESDSLFFRIILPEGGNLLLAANRPKKLDLRAALALPSSCGPIATRRMLYTQVNLGRFA
jgi:hypothetical protein